MKVLLFGATGMVGQGVLRECLLDPDVDMVQTIGRSKSAIQHPKLREVIHQDFWNYAAIEVRSLRIRCLLFLSRSVVLQDEGGCVRTT